MPAMVESEALDRLRRATKDMQQIEQWLASAGLTQILDRPEYATAIAELKTTVDNLRRSVHQYVSEQSSHSDVYKQKLQAFRLQRATELLKALTGDADTELDQLLRTVEGVLQPRSASSGASEG